MKKNIYQLILLCVSVSILFVYGCQKDLLQDETSQNSIKFNGPLSILSAREWMEKRFEKSSSRSDSTILTDTGLRWSLAKETFLDEGRQKVIVVPLKTHLPIFSYLPKNAFVELLIYKDSLGEFTNTTLVFVPKDSMQTNFTNIEDFTGYVFSQHRAQQPLDFIEIVGGEWVATHHYISDTPIQSTPRYENPFDGGPKGGGCYSFGPNFWKKIGNGFDAVGNGIKWVFTDRNPNGSTVSYHVNNDRNFTIKAYGEQGGAHHSGGNGGTTSSGNNNSGYIKNPIMDLFSNDLGKMMDLDDDCFAESEGNNAGSFLGTLVKMDDDFVLEFSFLETLTAYFELKKTNPTISFQQVANENAKVKGQWSVSPLLNPIKDKYPIDIVKVAINPAYKAALQDMVKQAIDYHKQCLKSYPSQPREGISSSTCNCFKRFNVASALDNMTNVIYNVKVQQLKEKYPQFAEFINTLVRMGTPVEKITEEIEKLKYELEIDKYIQTKPLTPKNVNNISLDATHRLCANSFTLGNCISGLSQNYCIQSAGIRAMSLILTDAAGNAVPFVSLPLAFNIPGNNLGNALNQQLLAQAVNSAFARMQRVVSGLESWPTRINAAGVREPTSLQSMFTSFIHTALDTIYDNNGIINEPSVKAIKESGMDSTDELMRDDNERGSQSYFKYTIQNPNCQC